MDKRMRELVEQADIKFSAHWQHQGVDTAVIIPSDLEKFAELIVRECAKWMSDGNIPDGFYEAGRMLEHFGVE